MDLEEAYYTAAGYLPEPGQSDFGGTVLEGVGRLSQCRCWVRNLSDEEAFGVRFGAHNPVCPAYQRSKDPVDDVNDHMLRRRMQVEYR